MINGQDIENQQATDAVKNESAENRADNGTQELEKKILELEALIKEKDEAHLRMAAEYENFRRRTREEREGAYASAVADTVGELLPIIDNLERAANFDDGEKVKEGLVLTLKSVDAVLGKLGVESMGAKGDIFDPNLHNAVLHEEVEGLGEGEITDVFQKGYKIGKRVIRFAMVKTAN